jgi:aryl-alcohol dehydrogenase-like predicted oxidoreductase
MSPDFRSALLGRTGLRVGRLGVAASYGVPASAVERAFDSGVNYFYWGSRRTGAFAEALQRLKPRRERLALTIQSYSRVAGLLGLSLERAFRKPKYEYADILLLGAWNHDVPPRILDDARRLQERGLTRFLGVSTHARTQVPLMAAGRDFDVVHLRYNAAHQGAEQDIFPFLPGDGRPGLVSFTAMSWGQLIGKPVFFRPGRRIPTGERVPTGTDC